MGVQIYRPSKFEKAIGYLTMLICLLLIIGGVLCLIYAEGML